LEEIDAITSLDAKPTFENTLLAYDSSGKFLNGVTGVYYNQLSVNTIDSFQNLARQLNPRLSAHYASILLNDKLFQRIQSIYDERENLELATDELKFLEDTYLNFVRGGALLNVEEKKRVKALKSELSALTLKFGQNVQNDTNAFEIVLDDEAELSGLPESLIETARSKAKDKGLDGKFLILANRSMVEPITTFGHNRELRKKVFIAYNQRADRNNQFDNKALIESILEKRRELVAILGYKDWTEYALEQSMAKTSDRVFDLVSRVWDAALIAAKKDIESMQALIHAEGGKFELQAWDYRYYMEKIRAKDYAISEAEIKQYFVLENVRDGAFRMAEKLYGIQFVKRDDIPVYHEDVNAWEVLEADGTHIGVFFTDYLIRDTKKSGAWKSSYRKKQSKDSGENVTPIIVNVCNFPRPTENTPSLLSLNEVTTLFHELGHALHGLFSDCRIRSQSGSSVARDFAELPAMIQENWALKPELLKTYAFHYETGEVIPDSLLEKIEKTSTFNQGFPMVEFLAAVILDLEYHKLRAPLEVTIDEFEEAILTEKYGMMAEIFPRYRSTNFLHIFAGGYSSRYYAYLWSEVLDADAFEVFEKNGVFNKAIAESFREHILSKGNSQDSMELYLKFRGEAPDPSALLKRRGFM
jgi:peptidyl-dipeptidase Dcp